MALSDPLAVVLGSFVGGLFGVLGGLLGAYLSTRAEYRRHVAALRAESDRHVMTLGMQLALEEWKQTFEAMKVMGGAMYPPSVSVLMQAQFLRLVFEGRFTTEAYRELCKQRDAFMDEIERDNAEMKQKPARPRG